MKYQIIGLVILILQFGIITWDGIKNKNQYRKRWTGISKVAFALIGPIELVAILYGRSMLGYNGKTAAVVMCMVGLVFIYLFLIDRNRRGGPTRMLNKISRNPMYLGLILVYLGIMIMFLNWLLVIWTVFTLVIIYIQIFDEEKKMKLAAPKAFRIYKRRVFRFFGIKRWWFVLGMCLVVVLGVFCGNVLSQNQVEKISKMSFKEMVAYNTKNTSEIVLTVGTIDNGKMKYTVYGRNAEELEHEKHTYELGSSSKLLTAALVNKAISEGKMNLSDEISAYIDLPAHNFYPTIQELLTHTSGYKSFYYESPMLLNGLVNRNIYYGIKSKSVINRARTRSLPMEAYDFKYSNYGYALLGAVLAKVYGDNYTKLLNEYTEQLGLKNTGIGSTDDDLGKYTKWFHNDAYLASNGIKSDVGDMLEYVNRMMNDPAFAGMANSLRTVGDDSSLNKKYNIHVDEIGMSWNKDNINGFVWISGSSDNYNVYIGFSPSTKKAVVVMSNMPRNYRISSTVIGIRKLRELVGIKKSEQEGE